MLAPRLLAMALAGAILLALTAHGSWGVRHEPGQETERQRQLLQSLVQANARWQVPESANSAYEAGEASGGEVLNSGHVNWYWIPSKMEPSTSRKPRLDASAAAAAGDPIAPIFPEAGLSPLVLDHIFTGIGQQGWANVHAFRHGELLTGQMQLKHLPSRPPPPPPERHVDPTRLEGLLHGVVDEVSLSLSLSLSVCVCECSSSKRALLKLLNPK